MTQTMLKRDDSIIFFAGDTPSVLLGSINTFIRTADVNTVVLHNQSVQSSSTCRLAIVAKDYETLLIRIEQAASRLKRGVRRSGRIGKGIYYCDNIQKNKGGIAIVFPGQGSQYPSMGKALASRYPSVKKWIQCLDDALSPILGEQPSRFFFDGKFTTKEHPKLYDLDTGASIVSTMSLAYYDLFQQLGIQPSVMLGHSTGEVTGLLASGHIEHGTQTSIFQDFLSKLVSVYRSVSSSFSAPMGTLYSVGGISSDVIRSCFREPIEHVFIALDNCPNQKIVYCPDTYAKLLKERLQEVGAIVEKMPFRYAYHTPLFAEMSQEMMAFYKQLNFVPSKIDLVSCISTQIFPTSENKARQQACDLLSGQVRFQETIEYLNTQRNIQTFIEIGPRNNTSSFIADTLRGKPYVYVVSSAQTSLGEVEGFLEMIGQLFTIGHISDIKRLYSDAYTHDKLQEETPEHTLAIQPSEKVESSDFIKTHFAIMQDFLHQQERVMRLFMQHKNISSSPVEKQVDDVSLTPFLLGKLLTSDGKQSRWERIVSVENEPYLFDHSFGGIPSLRQKNLSAIPVIPFTFSLETVAEAAKARVGTSYEIQRLFDVRALSWLTCDDEILPLEIIALNLSDTLLLCQVFNTSHNQRHLAFEAKVELVKCKSTLPQHISDSSLCLPSIPTPYTTKDFYIGTAPPDPFVAGEFHGAQFQAVKSIHTIGEFGICGQVDVLERNALFKDVDLPQFILDPVMIDAAMHLVNYWAHSKYGVDLKILPFQLNACSFFSEPKDVAEHTTAEVKISFVRTSGDEVPETAAYRFYNHQGDLIEERFLNQVYNNLPPVGSAYHKLWPDDLAIDACIDFVGEDGQLLVQLDALLQKHFSVPIRFDRFTAYPSHHALSELGNNVYQIAPFEDDFLSSSGGIWLKSWAYLVLTKQERLHWATLPKAVAVDYLYRCTVCKDLTRAYLLESKGERLSPMDLCCDPCIKDNYELWQCWAIDGEKQVMKLQTKYLNNGYYTACIAEGRE